MFYRDLFIISLVLAQVLAQGHFALSRQSRRIPGGAEVRERDFAMPLLAAATALAYTAAPHVFKTVKDVAPKAFAVWTARSSAPMELDHALSALERAMGVLQRGSSCAMSSRELDPLTQRIEDMADKIKEISV